MRKIIALLTFLNFKIVLKYKSCCPTINKKTSSYEIYSMGIVKKIKNFSNKYFCFFLNLFH